MQTCKITGQTLPLSEYYTKTVTRKDGTTYIRTDKVCKEARKQQMRKRYEYQKAMKAYNDIAEHMPEPTFWDKVVSFFNKRF